MPFHFTCPYCFKKTLVEDKYAGQTGPCATCGKTVTLPMLKGVISETLKRSSGTLFIAGQIKAVENAGPIVGHLASFTEDSNRESTERNEPIFNSTLAPDYLSESITPPAVMATTIAVPNAKLRSTQRKRKFWFLGAGMFAVIVFGVVAYKILLVLFSSSFFQDLQERRNRALCMNNLSKIAQALNSYAATHGTYPPAIVYDDKGKPKHSWRVLILRELGENTLYNQYKLDEPWDSESNSVLFAQCPSVFTSPGVGKAHESSYFLVVGVNTLFPIGSPMKPQDITDGSSQTILVVEALNLTHEWTKPIDIINGGSSPISMGGNHRKGFTAASADGSPLWIPDETSPVLINSLITPAGNDTVDVSAFTP